MPVIVCITWLLKKIAGHVDVFREDVNTSWEVGG